MISSATGPTQEDLLLSSVILDPRGVTNTCSSIVSGEDFEDLDKGHLWTSLVLLHEAGKPIGDPGVLKSELPRLGVESDLCSGAFIASLLRQSGTASNAVYYATEIAKRARMRRLLVLLERTKRLAGSPEADANELRELLMLDLSAMDSGAFHEAVSFRDGALELVSDIRREQAQDRRSGLFTGIYKLDDSLGSLMPGEMMILAARPGGGKTALAMQMAEHNSQHGRATFFASLEMGRRELIGRYLCPEVDIDSRDLRSGNLRPGDIDRLEQAAKAKDLPLLIWAPSHATLPKVRAAARHAKQVHDTSLVVIDYVGRITPDREQTRLPPRERIAAMAVGCKSLAKELGVAVILLCQLNRESTQGLPGLQHLAESSTLEAEADCVLMLHHPDGDKPHPYATREAIAVIAKDRFGATGIVKLNWTPSTQRFTDQDEVPSRTAHVQRVERVAEFDTWSNEGTFK